MTPWTDLLDPAEAELRTAWPYELTGSALDLLLAPHTHDDEPRPRMEAHGDYSLGVLLVPVLLPDEDRVFYQECDVLLTAHEIVTVRKTPPDGPAMDFDDLRSAGHISELSPGMIAYHVVDEVAEGFLDLVDALNDEIDELEDNVDVWKADVVRRRLSALRHDLLHIRRTLAPTRDAIRRVVDDRIELESEELFPRDVELRFGDSFDKLLRASEGLETARDLIGGVRDYHQGKLANDQNEVMKRLTLMASIFLPPTFIVGVYGQNFRVIPELAWGHGYGFSWFLIISTTIAQLIYFKRHDWF